MKKHELLEKAMRDYPVGTHFNSAQMGKPNVSTGRFEMSLGDNVVMIPQVDGGVIYSDGKWAKIIADKVNQTKPITVDLFVDGKIAIVRTGEIEIIENSGKNMFLRHSDLEEIWEAYQSLQK